MRLLLHACCGPCLLEPFDAFAGEHDVDVVFFNPNIHPAAEYELRRDTLRAYAGERGIATIELEYDPAEWMRAVAGLEHDPPARCRACYRLRLGRTARYATEHGYDAISTTLTVSPYQDPESIAEEGRAAAEEAGVEFVERDFRDRYQQATQRSRDLGMYRQNYCGCLLSDLEARADRERRREERRARKRAGG